MKLQLEVIPKKNMTSVLETLPGLKKTCVQVKRPLHVLLLDALMSDDIGRSTQCDQCDQDCQLRFLRLVIWVLHLSFWPSRRHGDSGHAGDLGDSAFGVTLADSLMALFGLEARVAVDVDVGSHLEEEITAISD